jgi:hypothetical protein
MSPVSSRHSDAIIDGRSAALVGVQIPPLRACRRIDRVQIIRNEHPAPNHVHARVFPPSEGRSMSSPSSPIPALTDRQEQIWNISNVLEGRVVGK